MPMERFLKQYDKEYMKMADKEYMKMAMLRHEETFRQQVHELHRIYRVQKLLMRDMKKAQLKKQMQSTSTQMDVGRWNAENYSDQRRPQLVLDLELPAEEYIGKENDGDVLLEVEEENDLDLSLAIGSNRRRRGKKEETPIASDSGASFSSSSTESGGVKPSSHEWGLYRVPDIGMRFQIERQSAFDIEERMRQDGLKQPPWLYQCLV